MNREKMKKKLQKKLLLNNIFIGKENLKCEFSKGYEYYYRKSRNRTPAILEPPLRNLEKISIKKWSK